MKKRIKTIQAALTLFRATRDYSDFRLRNMCFYHTYIKYEFIMDEFMKPRSYFSMLRLCNQLIAECDRLEDLKLFGHWDYELVSESHYFSCKRYLYHLRAYMKHYPLLWLYVFQLRR